MKVLTKLFMVTFSFTKSSLNSLKSKSSRNSSIFSDRSMLDKLVWSALLVPLSFVI